MPLVRPRQALVLIFLYSDVKLAKSMLNVASRGQARTYVVQRAPTMSVGCSGRSGSLAVDRSLTAMRRPTSPTGFGNRIGWYLTAAALGRALNVSMITHWSVGNLKAGKGQTSMMWRHYCA